MKAIQYEHPTDWLKDVSGNSSMNGIAERTGLPYSTINRRFQLKEIPSDEIIVIARAYGVSPVDALVQCGKLTVEEATGTSAAHALRFCPISDIAAEIVRRNTAGIDQEAINDPNTFDAANDGQHA